MLAVAVKLLLGATPVPLALSPPAKGHSYTNAGGVTPCGTRLYPERGQSNRDTNQSE